LKKAFKALLLIGIGLLVLSLLLNERISNLSSWYRVSLLNTYDSTIAETDGFKLVETFEKVGSKSTQTRKVYLINYIGNFTIDNINYTEDVSFHEMRYTSKKEATRIYNTLSHQPFTFKIYYDKKNPLFTLQTFLWYVCFVCNLIPTVLEFHKRMQVNRNSIQQHHSQMVPNQDLQWLHTYDVYRK